MRALVVDDSRASRSIVARTLRDLRFDCDEAANGVEAIARLAAGPRPDVVTVNWHMPVMDGIELVRKLRAHPQHRDLRLLMVSTESERARIELALAAGADDFVSKPFTPDALARKLVGLGVCSAAAVSPAAARGPIRVLVVDDSATIRSLLTATLSADPDLKVVGAAVNGRMAVEMVAAAAPDVVLLDVEMPVLDGISALREIRRLAPKLPVIMFSSLTDRGAKATLDALLAGANDYAAKPAGLEAAAITAVIEGDLVAKIKSIARKGPRLERTPAAPTPAARPPVAPSGPVRAVVIAVSTGGPTALAEVLPSLAADAGVPVLIVQHMPAFFTAHLAERLSKICGRTVREAGDTSPIGRTDILLAPGGRHFAVTGDAESARVRLTDDPPENSCRPAADVLFRSAAKTWGPGVLGVVLTGMGRDGVAGARAIVEAGGTVIAQDEFSSVVWGMPGEVAKAGLADAVLPLARIGPEVSLRLARRGR